MGATYRSPDTSAPAGPVAGCFHCGLAVPAGAHYAVAIDGLSRPMCCPGCQAVARAIVGGGFSDYYRHRTALPASPREALPEFLDRLSLYDAPEIQRGFVRDAGEHAREASLILEGITCAACVWLNEQHLARLPGVRSVEVNYTSHRARVSWDDRAIKLSEILRAVAAIGYTAHPYDAARQDEVHRRERRAALWQLFVAGFGMMQVMMYALPVYLAGDGEMSADIETLMRWASLVLTLPVVLYSGAPFFRGAWRDLRFRRLGMDVPVALGIGLAFVASCWATVTGKGEVYFDSIAMFVFLLLTGRFLEMGARRKASEAAEQLVKLIPASAWHLAGYPGSRAETRVSVSGLAPGDVVLVKPGETVPADGRVTEGVSEVDEALLTGEARPLDRRPGDALTGGTLNLASPLVMRVEKVGQDTVLAAIVRLLDRALAEKPRIAAAADRVAGGFVLAVLVVAVAVFALWLRIDPERALWVTVSVLVVTCPCALSLATPAALAAATGRLTRLGLLTTRGHALETLARATHFVFDKTGTLTFGRMALKEVRPLGRLSIPECNAIAAALERGSEHAVGRALAAAAVTPLDAQEVVNVPGAGIEGMVEGARYRLGTQEFVGALHGRPAPGVTPAAGAATLVALGDCSGWLTLFGLADELRPEGAALVAGLRNAGKQVILLSGDGPEAVLRVARQLGIETVVGGATPARKMEFVKELQERGAVVAMVGDGVNDAPVLAKAQVSIAMGEGTQVAQASADMVLLSGRLDTLLEGCRHAARTMAVVRQNFAWAIAYNLVALPLAVAGLITPWMAGIGMAGSSLLVVLNALRLAGASKEGRALTAEDAEDAAESDIGLRPRNSSA
ncbi:MAG: cadmium-translocating P-type ATPase [Betaproteobacteria bacterium]|nr:cadmium-translocating P-type ATPase [Betaproteobacteria bacterium]